MRVDEGMISVMDTIMLAGVRRALMTLKSTYMLVMREAELTQDELSPDGTVDVTSDVWHDLTRMALAGRELAKVRERITGTLPLDEDPDDEEADPGPQPGGVPDGDAQAPVGPAPGMAPGPGEPGGA